MEQNLSAAPVCGRKNPFHKRIVTYTNKKCSEVLLGL